jgi:branched-subunit amino acid transport protein
VSSEKPEIEFVIAQGKTRLESKRMSLHSGLLGLVFGSKESAPTNIVGFAVVLCLVTIVALIFIHLFGFNKNPKDFWKILSVLSPIVTVAMGYMFGKS